MLPQGWNVRCTLAAGCVAVGLVVTAAAQASGVGSLPEVVHRGAGTLRPETSPDASRPQGYEGYQVVEVLIETERELEALRGLLNAGREFELWSEVLMPGRMKVRVAPAGQDAFAASGLRSEVVVADLQEYLDERFGGDRGGDFFSTLRTYAEHEQFIDELVAQYPTLTEKFSLGTSVEGRPMWALHIKGSGTDKPGVMFHGSQHGNEQAGASVVAYLASHLLSNYGTDDELTWLVDHVDWYLLPIMNPDGYVAFRRRNSNNIDLNRNWGGPGSGQDATGGYYPFSEPETAAMRDFFLSHADVRVHVDVHGYVNWIMWPWGHSPELCPRHYSFAPLGREIHDRLLASGGGEYDWGPGYVVSYWVSGGSMDYSYGVLGLWSFTFEVIDDDMPETCEEFLSSLLFLGGWIADCNENGVPDVEEIAAGTSLDVNSNQVPDECESDCNDNGVPDEWELATGAVGDCNGNAYPDDCDVADGLGTDVNGDGLLDDCVLCEAGAAPRVLVPGGAAQQQAGCAVGVSGTTAVIGAFGDADLGFFTGAVHVCEWDGATWVPQDELHAADATVFASFGWSVAISGNVLVVGAEKEAENGTLAGAAYVFRRSGGSWQQEAKLLAADGVTGDHFGCSVGCSANLVAVGAWGDDDLGSTSGAVYVFARQGGSWVQVAKLTEPEGDADYRFGESVAVCGDTIVVGASSSDAQGESSGAAYVYVCDGLACQPQGQLLPANGGAGHALGTSIAVSGDTVVVGALGYLDPWHEGAAHVFHRDGAQWSEQATLLMTDPAYVGGLGQAVSIAGNPAQQILVGADGAAYLYRQTGDGWYNTGRFAPADVASTDQFGTAVALSGVAALVGAPGDDTLGQAAGAVRVFQGVGDCNESGLPDACDLAAGTSVDANGNGVPDECEWSLGDLNCDGEVNTSDVRPFVLAVAAPQTYAVSYPYCHRELADCNGDGIVNNFDIASFAALLAER
ncbi:MAG: M14 family zinc carboxypeptidase [Phycisphaerae bacterium]|jgi:hypothetical protein